MRNLSTVVMAGLVAINEAKLQGVVFTEKALSDFVSQEDLLSDARMAEAASKEFPDLPVFTEESAEPPDQLPENFIAIDPLDGSNNRSRNRDAWGITATLVENRVPVLAAAYIRYHGRGYFLKAQRGKGLFLKEARKGKEFQRFKIRSKLIGTRYSVPGSPKVSQIPIAREYQDFLTKNDLWRSNVAEGCATANVMGLLKESTDIYVNAATGNILDVAGLQLMLKEAGGYVSDCKGQEPIWYQPWLPVIFSRNEEIAKPYLML